jgi:hypothetical protein
VRTVVPRVGAVRALAIFMAIAAALAAAPLAPPARAQELSPGCAGANDSGLDGLHDQGGWLLRRTFAAGETLTVSARRPTRPPLTGPASITLKINGATVDTAPFPGTVRYTFTAAGGYTASWSVTSGSGSTQATWHVGCSLSVGATPPPTSKAQCKHAGWRAFGSMFKNRGDCVSFVATHGKNPPSGSEQKKTTSSGASRDTRARAPKGSAQGQRADGKQRHP